MGIKIKDDLDKLSFTDRVKYWKGRLAIGIGEGNLDGVISEALQVERLILRKEQDQSVNSPWFFEDGHVCIREEDFADIVQTHLGVNIDPSEIYSDSKATHAHQSTGVRSNQYNKKNVESFIDGSREGRENWKLIDDIAGYLRFEIGLELPQNFVIKLR